jgi:hypothetical protein
MHQGTRTLVRSFKYATEYRPKSGILLSRPNGKKNEVAEKTRKRLGEEGFHVNDVQDTNTDFHFQIQNPNVSIIIEKQKFDRVTLATYVAFPKLDQELFAFMNKEGKKFFWNLRDKLIAINVGYTIHPSMEKVERIDITKVIYFDGLTKNIFFNSLSDVQRGIESVNL